ncbi:Signal transduction histidine kinase [Hahella chejuensis KCTC 2396]|uniref:histidine kinase n=1 Tax=Hahella chejuensis (strain KCTC 2396) TaxID=349521 RepID=Q2SQE9_HAHCH|nr:ATP-binding protein [Hahella chejuensis]ABC27125.1 Signal transduction histidine kinase [Hahella chejuensis KCTC 2396]
MLPDQSITEELPKDRKQKRQPHSAYLRRRLMTLTSIIIVSMFALEAAVTAWYDYRAQLANLEKEAYLLADAQRSVLAAAVWNFDFDIINNAVNNLFSMPEIMQVAIRYPDGEVIASAGKLSDGAAQMRITRPLLWDQGGEKEIGTLNVVIDISQVESSMLVKLTERSVTLSATLFICLAAIYLACRWMTQPLEELTAAITRLADGDLEQRIPHTQRNDEIGNVARALVKFSENSRLLYDLQNSLTFNVAEKTRQLKQVREDSAHDNTVRARLLAMVSQEIRSPMTAIQGAVMLCKNGLTGEIQEKTLHMLHVAERNCERMQKLIEVLFDIYQIQNHSLVLTLSPVNLLKLARTQTEIWRNKAYQTSKNLHFESGVAEAWVRGDEKRLQQIIDILLSNAVRHSGKGGEISVHLRREGALISLSVSDNGPGIPKKIRPYLFEGLARSDEACSDSLGSGFSLTLAKGLVELQGGQIYFESIAKEISSNSTLPTGATFYLELPYIPAPEAAD